MRQCSSPDISIGLALMKRLARRAAFLYVKVPCTATGRNLVLSRDFEQRQGEAPAEPLVRFAFQPFPVRREPRLPSHGTPDQTLVAAEGRAATIRWATLRSCSCRVAENRSCDLWAADRSSRDLAVQRSVQGIASRCLSRRGSGWSRLRRVHTRSEPTHLPLPRRSPAELPWSIRSCPLDRHRTR